MLRDLARNLRNPEVACKEYFLRTDTELTSIVIGAAACLVPPMSYLDYTYYGLGPDFYLTAALEALFAVFSVIVILFIRRNSRVKFYENLVFAWSMVIAMAAVFADFLQPDRIVENLLISELLLLAIYILIANRISYRMIPVATITSACITALFSTQNAASLQERYLFTLTLILLNAVGIIVIGRNNRFKRVEYESQYREREARITFEALAATDTLTGIPNRRSFLKLAELALDRFHGSGASFCLAIFDLDHFKQINDTHGHPAGDEALKQFTALINSRKRATDILGRLGGDEFGFILPRVDRTVALKVVSRLQNALLGLTIPSPAGDFHISFSAGLTEARAEDRSPDDLVRRADAALYESKGKGGDRIEAG
jgi:diguanylate cyclase (GGDEF)-like protein